LRDTRTLLDRVCDPLRAPGRRAWYFLQPYGLADAYLTCASVSAFADARGTDDGEIHVLLKQSHAPIGRLFGGGRVRFSVADDRWMEAIASDLETTGLRSELVPDLGIVLHPRHFERTRGEPVAAEVGSRRRVYERMLRLPEDAAASRPSVPEAIRREASAVARSAAMPAGRAVLLVPDSAQALDADWARLAAALSARGLAVFTLTRVAPGAAPRAAIAGTTGLDAGLELLLPLCEHAGRAVVGDPGIVELLVEADPDCRIVVLPSEAFGPLESTVATVLGTDAPVDAPVAAPPPPADAPDVASPYLHADGELALCALHEVQFSLNPSQRDAAAAVIARKVNETVPRIARPTDATALQALHEHGLVSLGRVFGAQQVSDIVEYFRRTPCFSAHVASYSDGVPHSVDEAATLGAYGSYRIDQALQAPHLLELALNEELLNLCDHYLGCLPTLYSVHAWWTFVDSPTPGGTHLYHRDQDDHRFLSMFTYLTDVGPDDGPIDLLRGSHQPRVVAERIAAYRRANPGAPAASQDHYFPPHGGDGYDRGEGRYPIPYEALFEDRLSTVVGPAGSAFLADTFALHRGNPPSSRHRLACWIRYGLAKSRTYTMDRTHRVPASLLQGRVPRGMRMDWVTRLLVDHGR
jgi:hypothetical protein